MASHLTNGELIELLKKLPPDNEAWIVEAGGASTVGSVDLISGAIHTSEMS